MFKIILLMAFRQTGYATKHPHLENRNPSRRIFYVEGSDRESIQVTSVCIKALLSGKERRRRSSEGGAGFPGPTPAEQP